MYKLDLEKTEEPEIKLPTSVGSEKNQSLQQGMDLTTLICNFLIMYDVEHSQ